MGDRRAARGADLVRVPLVSLVGRDRARRGTCSSTSCCRSPCSSRSPGARRSRRWMPRALGTIAVALAALFAVVGLVEEATHRLLFYTSSVEVGNAYSSFFRVTSLFRDPSLYGRHVVLGIAVLLVALLYRAHRLGHRDRGDGAAVRRALLLVLAVEPRRAVRRDAVRRRARRSDRNVRIVAVATAVLVVARRRRRTSARRRPTHSTEKITSDRWRRIDLTREGVRAPPDRRRRHRLAAAREPARSRSAAGRRRCSSRTRRR